MDVGGNIQRDPNGEIIFVPITPLLDNGNANKRVILTDNNHIVEAILIEGFIYTDDGQPIYVQKVVSIVEYEYTYDEQGNRTKREFITDAYQDQKTNCYGNSLADGKYLIPGLDGYNYKVILNSDYIQVEAKESNVTKGDVLALNGGEHLIVAVGKNKNNETIWSSKNGFGDTFVGTLEELQKTHADVEGDEWIDFSMKNATLYQKKGDDVVRKDGTPYVNEAAKEKMQKDYTEFQSAKKEVEKAKSKLK